MSGQFRPAILALILSLSVQVGAPAIYAADGGAKTTRDATKPLSNSVKRALAYLVSQQQENGGWSQGTESNNMGSSLDKIAKLPNVGDTCMAALALVRSGSYPNKGEYAKNLAHAANFVCGRIEKSDDTSLSVTDVQGTRIQMKLGPYIDTFLASLFLSEVKGHMPDKHSQIRVGEALDKVIAKMEHNQGADGKWASGGWAPIHAQAIAMKGLNRAKQEGAAVKEDVLAKAESFAKSSFDSQSRTFAGGGSAGVPLYAAGATLGSLQESINTGAKFRSDALKTLANKNASEKDREEAKDKLSRLEGARRTQTEAVDAVVGRLGDSRFVQGFGCNGGEEFLSYLNISEALKANDAKKWCDWDEKMTQNISHIQNSDGSWMGQHCITSKTFVTAAALLVLTVDRESTAISNKLSKR